MTGGFHSCCCASLVLNRCALHNTCSSLYSALQTNSTIPKSSSVLSILTPGDLVFKYTSQQGNISNANHYTHHSTTGWTNESTDMSYSSTSYRIHRGGEPLKAAASLNSPSQPSDPETQQSWWVLFTRRQPAGSGSPFQQSFITSITWHTTGRMSLDVALSWAASVSLRGLWRQMSVSNPPNVLISLQSLPWSLFPGPTLSLTPSLYWNLMFSLVV